jgi:hypothetical protein
VHAFVDESKRRGYLVAAVVTAPSDLAAVRRALRGLLLPGQSTVHFRDEDDRRRRRVLSTISGLPITARLFVSPSSDAVIARQRCLTHMVSELLDCGVDRLVLEQSDGDLAADRRTLFRSLRTPESNGRSLSYVHLRAASEPILWAADAVAWARPKGGDCRRRLAPLEVHVTPVDT